jgi:acyl-CoA synthetase (AMP-forming)/AMP-acid ligase II
MTTNPYSSRPWLKNYDAHVPANLNYPWMSFIDMTRKSFREVPDRAAMVYIDTVISFKELDVMSNKFANFLLDRGVKQGDVVGLNMPNIPAYLICFVGAQKVGCITTGVSPLLTEHELEYQLNDSAARVLVTFDVNLPRINAVIAKTKVKTLVVAGVFDFMGPVDWKAPPGEMKKEGAVEVYNSIDILKKYPDKEVDTWVDRDSDCLMQYTGGTTGPSKGAILTNRNISHQILQWVVWTDSKIGEEVGVSAFPLFHQAGLFYGFVGLSTGMTQVLIPNPRDVAFIITQIKKYKPTVVANVPTLFMEMMKIEEFKTMDLSFVKFYGSGAAPFPAELIKQFYEIVGDNKLVEVYGMTETSPLLTGQPFLGKKKVGSVGMPMPDTEVKLVDPATGELAKLGEPGELCARGPQIMRGYHNKPEETANSIRDGYMHTGDVATMDEDGFFFIVDRLKDMVSVSGMKVFTRELDEIIARHPDIEMCASVGVPDPVRDFTEIVATAVVLKPGVEANDAARQSIISFMRERVAPYKVPKQIIFMDSLPLSAVGKILKRELREMLKPKAK